MTHGTNLKDISDIAMPGDLSTRYVDKCKELRDFAFLEKNRNIKGLFLVDVDYVEFVSGMTALKND